MVDLAPVKKSRGKSLLWGLAAMALGVFFVVDVFIPDPVPFLDEIAAGVLTFVSGFKALQALFEKDKQR